MDPEIPLGALVSIVHRAHFIALNAKMRYYDLSAGQLFALLYLSKRQGTPQDALARHFHHNKATIARAIARLERGGYVRRVVDPENRRAVRLYLTQKGNEIIPIILALDRDWETEVCRDLSDDEQNALRKLLMRIAEKSCALGDSTTGVCNGNR
jgi:DNA-binding MarR family transcriptional regulator